ncbi:MAG: PAS domain S-box protein, partial [Spirochaetales bacterium]|nr:PAS domain S-box protein [Spirochaetales bacterium]
MDHDGRIDASVAQLYLDLAGTMFVVIGRDGSIKLLNKAGCRILGVAAEDVLGKNWFDLFVPPAIREEVKRVSGMIFSGHLEPGEYHENKVLTVNGEERLIAWHNAILRDENGVITDTISSGEDITERRHLEESLRVSEALYRTLFDVLPMGVTISDDKGGIVKTNKQASDILGIDPLEHVKRRLSDPRWRILRKDGTEFPPEEYASAIALREQRLVENVEMGVYRGDDSLVWLSVSAAPVPVEHYGVVVVYHDTTEQVRSEERIRSLLAEKELILKETHHRVKNNMNTISSLLTLQAHNLQGEAGDYLREAASRVQSMMLLYGTLYQSEDFNALHVGPFLTRIVEQVLEIFNAAERVRATILIDDFTLGSKSLTPLGIVVNEMVTNSLKYAFNDVPEPLIRLAITRNGSTVVVVY